MRTPAFWSARSRAWLGGRGLRIVPGQRCGAHDLRAYLGKVAAQRAAFAKLAGELTTDSRLRKLLTNMIYVGIIAEQIGVERTEIVNAITKQFKGKQKAIDPNVQAIDKATRDMALPAGVRGTFQGAAKAFQSSVEAVMQPAQIGSIISESENWLESAPGFRLPVRSA